MFAINKTTFVQEFVKKEVVKSVIFQIFPVFQIYVQHLRKICSYFLEFFIVLMRQNLGFWF